jgi:hypothetical protein
MSDLTTQMNRVVDEFVAQITELAKSAAIETLRNVLGTQTRRTPATTSTASAGRVRGRGAKRSPDELDKLAERFQVFVKENPGLRIEQINKQLGTTTKDLALPIRKLLADGSVHAKGQKRSTTYFAGGGGGGGGGGRKRKAKS